jgi:hypothetical protein
MNVRILVCKANGEIVGEKKFRYSELKKIRSVTIPVGEYLIILEVVGER